MNLKIYDQHGQLKTELSPDDNSTRIKEVGVENVLSLSFTLYEYLELDVNDYIDFEGERFWLTERYCPEEENKTTWKYNVQFYGIESLTGRYLVLNTASGQVEPVFTLTALPVEHMRLIVQSLNAGMDGLAQWKVGSVVGTENVTIEYRGKYCDEALQELAEKVGTEYWAEGTTVNLCRCEHGEAVTLAYGKGLISLAQDKADNAQFYTRLFPIGSSRNIDPERYGHSQLQLPGGLAYVDIQGLVQKYGVIHRYEESAFTGIYPRRIGTLSSVRSEEVTGADGNPFTIYHFKDAELNFDPNDYMLPGQVLRVSFQPGSELAGLGESDDHYFEVNYDSEEQEFELITIWPDGSDIQLPGGTLVPKFGDQYILWNLRMPDEYYPLAEAEFLEAVENYNEENTLDVSRYKGPTDYLYIQEQNIELTVGRRILLESAEYFSISGGYKESRITKITQRINLPTKMDLEISDALSTSMRRTIDNEIKSVRSYARSVGDISALPDIIKTGDSTRFTDNNILSSLRSKAEFLSRKFDDTVNGFITFEKGLRSKGNAVIDGLLTAYHAVMNNVRSSNYTGDGVADTGWSITNDYANGHSRLVVDYIYARMKLIAEALELKETLFSAGDQSWSRAGNEIVRTDYLDDGGNVIGYTEQKVPWTLKGMPFMLRKTGFFGIFSRLRKIRVSLNAEDLTSVRRVRCYFLAKDGEREVHNLWSVGDLVRCQTFNLATSKRNTYTTITQKAGNVFWWRRCCGVSQDAVTLDGKEYHYLDLEYNYIEEQTAYAQGRNTGYAACQSDLPCAGDKAVQFGHVSDPGRMNLLSIEVNGELNADAPCVKAYRGIYSFDLSKCWWGGASCLKMKLSPATGYEFYGPMFKFVTEYGVAKVPVNRGTWLSIVTERDDYGEHTQVRKLYYYNQVTHKGSLWLCINSQIADHYHWVDENGNAITDAAYTAKTDVEKALCSHVPDYVTSEPSETSSDWLKQVSKGTSIKSVTTTYAKQSAADYNGTPPTTGWQTSIGALGTINEGDYVWTKTVTSYSDTLDDTTTYSVAKWGIDGDGIHNIETKFYEDSQLKTQQQLAALAENKWKEYSELTLTKGDYIYTRIKITYDKNQTPTVSYSVNRIGQDGVGYVGMEEYYCLGNSNTTPPTGHPYTRDDGKPQTIAASDLSIKGEWSEIRPTYNTTTAEGRAKKYLWNFEVAYDTTTNVQVTQPLCIANYEKGIASIVELYAISAYSVAPQTGGYPSDISSWTDEAHDCAPTDAKPYQWNKTVTTYTDGSSDTFYHVSAVKGGKGDKGDNGTSTKMRYVNTALADGLSTYPNVSNYASYTWTDTPPTATEATPRIYCGVWNMDSSGNLIGAPISVYMCSHYGKTGEDGYTFSVSPASLIINQNINNASDFGLPKTFSTSVLRGSTAVVHQAVIQSLSGINVYRDDGNYSEAHTLTLSTITSDTATEGYFIVRLYVTSTDYRDIKVPVYINRLGTWKTNIENGISTEVGNQINYGLQEGGVIKTAYDAAITKSAQGLTQEFSEEISRANPGNPNLFGFHKGVEFNNFIPFIQGYGIVSGSGQCDIRYLGFGGETGYYTVSFEAKMLSSSKNITFSLDANGEVTNNKTITTSWTRYTLTFNVTGYGSSSFGLFYISGMATSNRIVIRHLKIERGRVATAFCEADEDIAYRGNASLVSEWTKTSSVATTTEEVDGESREVYYNTAVPSAGSHMDFIYKNSFAVLSAGKCYTLSFWARAAADNSILMCHLYDPAIISGVSGTIKSTDSAGTQSEAAERDGRTLIRLSTTWKHYYIHWYVDNDSTTARSVIPFRIEKSSTVGGTNYGISPTIYMTDIRIAEGYEMPYATYKSIVEQSARRISISVEDGLTRAGIDLEKGTVTLSGDKVEFTNANGTVRGKVWIDPESGTLYAEDGHFSGNVTATGGTIGGFSVGTNKLYNNSYHATIEIKSSDNTQIVRIGEEAIDPLTNQSCALYARNYNNGNHSTSLFLDASGALYNYAFHGNGNGVLNGLIFGYKIQYKAIPSGSSDINVGNILLRDGSTVVLTGGHSAGWVNVQMPTLGEVRKCLGISENDMSIPFAIEIDVLNQSSYDNVRLIFKEGSGTSYTPTTLPALMSFDNTQFTDSDSKKQLAQGDYMKIKLMYRNTTDGYRAFILVHNN